MEQRSSTYQSLKILLAENVPIDRDILHVGIGLVLTVIAVAMTRRALQLGPFLGAFTVACILGALMEFLDMRDDLQSLGTCRWRASTWDFTRTIFVPAVGLAVAWQIRKKRNL